MVLMETLMTFQFGIEILLNKKSNNFTHSDKQRIYGPTEQQLQPLMFLQLQLQLILVRQQQTA